MTYYSTYRWCGVPDCKNTSVKTPDKLWFRVPTDIDRRKTWFKVAGRDPEQLYKKTRLYFCEDHFDLEHDMENYIKFKIMGSLKRVQLKPDCIPSRFEMNKKHKNASNEPHTDETNLKMPIPEDSLQDLRGEGSDKASSSCLDGKIEIDIILDSNDQASTKSAPVKIKSEPEDNTLVEHGSMEQRACKLLDDRETEIKMESTDKAKMNYEIEIKVEPLTVELTEWGETEGPVRIKEEYMKEETEWEHDGCHSVSETESDAVAALYPGHRKKDEFVLGPERPDVVFTIRAQTSEMAERPALSDRDPGIEKGVNSKTGEGMIQTHQDAVEEENRRADDGRAQEPLRSGEERYPCQICNKNYKYLCHLKKHELIHSGIKPHTCGICNKKFSQLSKLRRHERSHTGDKPYSCGICKKSFPYPSHLKIHERSHTREKPYSCELCKQEFAQLGHLKTHEKTHTGEKPYDCGICKLEFVRSSDLKRHERTHSGEKPYGCGMCNKKFTDLGNLRKHERTHTGEKLHCCEVCNRKFTQLCHLKAHVRIHKGN